MNRFYESPQLAEDYVKYRPDYADSQIAERVVEYYRRHNTHKDKINLMLDVGCGNGQSTNLFQAYCNKIIGCDVSQEQLKQAKLQNQYDHIEYRVGQAEKIDLEDNTVDLVVTGSAIHWFDQPKFFQEVKRILKPSGCFSIFAYFMPEISLIGNNDVSSSRQGTHVLHTLLASAAVESPVNVAAQVSVIYRYDDIFKTLPFTQKKRIDDIHVVTTASINDICGYIRSVHLCESFLNRRIDELKSVNVPITKELIDLFDISTQFKTFIKRLWNLHDVSDDAKVLKVDTPFFVLLAKP